MAVLPYLGRFAPSPTGRLHVGVVRTLLAAWLDARAHGGRILLRVEDLDGPRVVRGAADELQRDLEWLGLSWDQGPVFQSARGERYRSALAELARLGRTYPCTCTRREITLASSAPHGPSDEGPRYPGTCRSRPPRPDRPAAIRLKVEPSDEVPHTDRLYGPVVQELHREVGDFVLLRSDGLWAYQLAVSVDDLLDRVTSVVRGRDLLASTPRQLLLRRLLDPAAPPLATLHLPLLLGPSGRRLAKRDGAVSVGELREAGVSAEQLLGRLAHGLRLIDRPAPITAQALAPLWRVEVLPREDAPWPLDQGDSRAAT